MANKRFDALSLLYGDEIRGNIDFCKKYNSTIEKYSHALMTLQPSVREYRDSWINDRVELQDIDIIKDFCSRASKVWDRRDWK
jgi:hypothetical protein